MKMKMKNIILDSRAQVISSHFQLLSYIYNLCLLSNNLIFLFHILIANKQPIRAKAATTTTRKKKANKSEMDFLGGL